MKSKNISGHPLRSRPGKRRTYICKRCGHIERTTDYGRIGLHPIKKHCGITLTPLDHEQTIAAHLITKKERVQWINKGGYILKGNKKKKRWIPVFSDEDIEAAIEQERQYVPKEGIVEFKEQKIWELVVKEFKDLYPGEFNEDVSISLRTGDLTKDVKKSLRLHYEEIFANQKFIDFIFHYIDNLLKTTGGKQCTINIITDMAGLGYPKIKNSDIFNEYWYNYRYKPIKNIDYMWSFGHITPKGWYYNVLSNIWEECYLIDYDYFNELRANEDDLTKYKNPCTFLKYVYDKEK
ncbi:MAG: hypothetical protein R6U11_03300 [Bacteroidales bacterium]